MPYNAPNPSYPVVLHHTSPVTGSWVERGVNLSGASTATVRKEMDPLGQEVGDSDPYANNAEADYLSMKDGEGERPYEQGGDPFDPKGGCSLDGLPILCSEFNMRIQTGSVQTQYVGLYEADPNRPYHAAARAVPVTRDIRVYAPGIYEIWMPPEFRGGDDFIAGGGYVFYAPPQDKFSSCLQSSGLDQDATANFDPEDADLINRISGLEGVAQNLLAITWRYETVFDMHPPPNNYAGPNPYYWDVGPFHINVRWTEAEANKGRLNFNGLARSEVYGLAAWGEQGSFRNPGYGRVGLFDGDPLSNGRMAARRLNAFGGTDLNKAMMYAPPDHEEGKGKARKWKPTRTFRGERYKQYAEAWAKFFNCYNQ